MINCIIRSSTYPDIFKIANIIPIAKPDEPLDNIESYRPINNIIFLEKLTQQYIKNHIDKYLLEQGIILKDHHGGRRKHSTTTAICQMQNKLHINYEKKRITFFKTKDLNKAYDTVDSTIMLKK